ncbi:RNA polymerase sigma factor [Mesorhizobium sp. LHD-90]|uniref:RNA polymerase sigma factor n=1 Tax=Mesorhizobium sp. LHD-90 TaxID=3071414 RepID=UPI0027E0B464|nr:RNA polymerase sigma factor [Mesorhizobium sp. LHD-90]MDQ6437857.1 RNA polymerase sigma factor [Mesorhizobium sp. LHD-90]
MTDTTDRVEDRLIAFLPNLRRFAISLSGSRDVADDLVQAACERALASADRFEPGTRFDAWMFRILRNLWIDQIRRRKTAGVQEDISDHHELSTGTGEREAEARMTLKSVAEAIGELADEQREVLLLVCVEELSYRDAAEVLGIPIGTVMSRLARARKNLGVAAGIEAAPARSDHSKGVRG